MKAHTYTDRMDKHTYTRIDKRKARKAYDKGLRFTICPCRLRPGYPYYPGISVRGNGNCTFDDMLDTFNLFHGCKPNNHSRYASFYIKDSELRLLQGEGR